MVSGIRSIKSPSAATYSAKAPTLGDGGDLDYDEAFIIVAEAIVAGSHRGRHRNVMQTNYHPSYRLTNHPRQSLFLPSFPSRSASSHPLCCTLAFLTLSLEGGAHGDERAYLGDPGS
ncbi:hypothetical protein PG984_012788 [Apiospora sp. TS-2023a]